MTQTRSLGSTLAAFFLLAEAILALGVAAFMLWNPDNSSNLTTLFERLQLSTAFSSLLALAPLLTAGVAGLLFRGLWWQQEWARVGTLVFMFLLVLLALALLAFMAAFDLASTANMVVAALLGIVAGVLFFLLLRMPAEAVQVRQEGSTPPPAATAVPDVQVRPDFVERAPAAVPPPAAAPAPSLRPLQAAPAGWVPPPPRSAPASSGMIVEAATRASRPADMASTQQIPVSAPLPRAWLTVRQGEQLGHQFEVRGDHSLTIGRDPNRVDAVLTDSTISGRHAQIRYEVSRFVIYDLGSTNGTFVNERLVQNHPLAEGDEIRLGVTTLLFSMTRA